MFYSNQILARKGPLGLVWIAAHMDKQLKRQQINSTSIPASVDTLLDPEVPLALRLSGQLMLGVVRIYGRKVAYLQQDCNDALVKIRVALRPADGTAAPAPLEAVTALNPAEAAAARAALKQQRAKRRAAAAAAGGDAAADAEGEGDEAAELMLWGDGFEWEQQVLLGGSEGLLGGYGLPGFRCEPSNRLSLGLTPSAGARSGGAASQDVSSMFGMYSSQDDGMEAFDVEDEEAAAVWDLDDLEVERLRAAPSLSQGGSGVSGLLGGPRAAGARVSDAAGGLQQQQQEDGGDLPPASPYSDSGFGGGAAAYSDNDPDTPRRAVTPVSGAAPGSLGSLGSFDAAAAAAALPGTPAAGDAGQEQAAAGGGHDDYDLDFNMSMDVADMLPDTPAADDGADGGADEAAAAAAAAEAGGDEGAAAAAAAGTPTKTFQRRNTRQQPAAAAAADDAAAAADEDAADEEEQARAVAAAARAARKRRASLLLGPKRRMVIDVVEEHEAAGGSKRGAAAAVGPRAATELPAAEIRALLSDRAPLLDRERGERASRQLQQQQQAAALQTSGAAALAMAAPAGAGRAALLPGLPNFGVSLAAGFAGGLGLPAQLQQLFAAASDAAAGAVGAAAGQRGGGGATARTARLDEIGDLGELDDAAGEAAGGSLSRGGRCSLSLHSTPGSAAAAAAAGGGGGRSPGSVRQQQQQLGAADAAAAPTPGSVGAGSAGEAGYSAGSLGRGLSAASPADEGDDDAAGADWLMGGDDDAYDAGSDGGAAAAGAGDGDAGEEDARALRSGAKAAAGPSRLAWPADAETLAEQEGAELEVSDGGFTSRTRLVVRHLQAAAAAAEAAPGGAGTPAGVGSKRRFSAAAMAPPFSGDGKQGGAADGAKGPQLSFNALTEGHGRMDACRWFYEVLVLTNKGFVATRQEEAYGDISVTPNLAAMARV